MAENSQYWPEVMRAQLEREKSQLEADNPPLESAAEAAPPREERPSELLQPT